MTTLPLEALGVVGLFVAAMAALYLGHRVRQRRAAHKDQHLRLPNGTVIESPVPVRHANQLLRRVQGQGQIAYALVGTYGARLGPKALAEVVAAGGVHHIAVVYLCEMDLDERRAAVRAIPDQTSPIHPGPLRLVDPDTELRQNTGIQAASGGCGGCVRIWPRTARTGGPARRARFLCHPQ